MQHIKSNILHWNQFIYAKKQSVKVVSYFSPKDNVWTSAESSRFQNKWFELLLWETCRERSIDSYVKIWHLHHFVFMSSIIPSVLGRHLHCYNSSLGRTIPVCEVKLPLLPYFQYIWCKYIIKNRSIPNLLAIYKMF